VLVGENVNFPELCTLLNLKPTDFKYTELKSELGESLREIFKGTDLLTVFYSANEAVSSDLQTLKHDLTWVGATLGRTMVLSRIGQSFSIQSLGEQRFLITDSHVGSVGSGDLENCFKYVLHAHTEGYSLILWAITALV
jgi:hypothetical protein